jgi:hypothetical protein
MQVATVFQTVTLQPSMIFAYIFLISASDSVGC